MPAKQPPQQPSDPIIIDDFSLGIFGDYHGGNITTSTGSIPANGAATIANTYACCADISGALGPLPAQPSSGSQTQTFLPVAGNTSTANRPAGNPDNYLVDALVQGNLYGLTELVGPTTGYTHNKTAIYTFHRFYWNSAGTGVASGYFEYSLVRMYSTVLTTLAVGAQDIYFNRTTALAPPLTFGQPNFPQPIAAGSLVPLRDAGSSDYRPTIGIVGALGPSWPANTAIPAPDSGYTNFDTVMSTIGATPLAGNWPSSSPSAIGSTLWLFPAVSSGVAIQGYPTSGQAYAIGGLATGHQARLVFVSHRSVSNYGFYFASVADKYFYTAALDFFETAGVKGNSELIGEENISGCGVLVSLEADELLVIKHRDGGYLVRGDLNNPTVQRLAQVESTYGICSHAINTPIGVVYGSRNGVFVWSGSQASKKLSNQIEGFFWEYLSASDPTYLDHHGRFNYWHPWVCVPNNYLFDTRKGGWWRLADPANRSNIAYSVYGVDAGNGQLYAFPYKQTSSANVVYDIFDPTVLATGYSWQSQPLVSTRERVQVFQQITLVMSPGANVNTNQTFAVTLSGFDYKGVAVTPVTTTITLSGAVGSQTQIQVKDIANFQAQYVTCRIVASGGSTGGGNGVAPKLHSIKFLVSDRASTPKS